MQFTTNEVRVIRCGYLVAEMEEDPPHACTYDGRQIISIQMYQGAWGPSGDIGLWVPHDNNEGETAERFDDPYGWWTYLAFGCLPGPQEGESTITVFEPLGTEFGQPGRILKSFVVSNSQLPDFLEDGEDSPESVDKAWRMLVDTFSIPFKFREFQATDHSNATNASDFHSAKSASLSSSGLVIEEDE